MRRDGAHGQGQSSPAPLPGGLLENTGASRLAGPAATVRGQVPRGQLVPISPDQELLASVAVGALAGGVMRVPGKDVSKPNIPRDAPGHLERNPRRWWPILHFPVGVEGGEVQRNVRAEMVHHPTAKRFDLRRFVILPRDQKRRDLEPDIRLMLQVFQGLEHWPEFGRTKVLVEALGKALQVDVGGVDVAEEIYPRLFADITRADCHRFDVPLAACLGHVDRVFQEDHRVVVGECD